MEEVRYMISDASKRIDVEAHVLRYWEEELELPISRNEMGHRYYRDNDIELLKTVKNLKEQGFQLKAVKMLLPNFNKLDSLDSQTMIKLKEELNRKVIGMWGEEKEPEKELEKEEATSLIAKDEKKEVNENTGDKMTQFKAVLNHIILTALKENNAILSQEISSNVSDNVIKEMNYIMRLQEEREEERYRKFDATLRDYQKGRTYAAASLDPKTKKKSKFFKKNKVFI